MNMKNKVAFLIFFFTLGFFIEEEEEARDPEKIFCGDQMLIEYPDGRTYDMAGQLVNCDE